jgi:hypothetical protein
MSTSPERPVSRAELAELMQQGHSAAHHLLQAMEGWDGYTRMAFFVVLITALNAIDRAHDAGFRAHARTVLLDILEVVPGLIERVPAE